MKKRLITTAIFILAMVFVGLALCGCTNISPYAPHVLQNKVPEQVTVYVSGAVQNEGYYTVQAGTSYSALVFGAGILPQSVLPQYYTDTIDGSVEEIIINWFDGTKECSSVNVNSPLIANRLFVEGISDSVVNKIADYIEIYGKIVNKQQLQSVLGDDSNEYLYRFFVAKEDYEKAC